MRVEGKPILVLVLLVVFGVVVLVVVSMNAGSMGGVPFFTSDSEAKGEVNGTNTGGDIEGIEGGRVSPPKIKREVSVEDFLNEDTRDILALGEEIKDGLYDMWPDIRLDVQKDNIIQLRLITPLREFGSKLSSCKMDELCERQEILSYLDELIAERNLCRRAADLAKDGYDCEKKVIEYSRISWFPAISPEVKGKNTLEEMKLAVRVEQ